MKSTNPKPIEFTKRSNERAREQRQTDFLRYLAQGESITDSCILIGISRSCYEKWRKHPEFRGAVESARESHRRDILSGFHTADAYARMLLDAIQRDESLPAALRYRASKSILSRKGKTDWLPEPLPATTAPLVPFEDEEDQHPDERPHAEPAPAPHPHSTNHEESIPNPKPAGPVIVNATVSRTTAPVPHANTMPQSEIAPASAECIPSNSLFPGYGSNPENPDKTPHPQSTANIMKDQQDPPTQPVSSRPAEFCNNPEIPHPAPPMEACATSHPAVHESEHAAAPIAVTSPANESLHAPAGHALSSAPAAPSASSPPSTTAPSPAATLSQTWLSAHFLHQHESP
ncbi:MAG: hypothetical protein LC126_12335, partial [Bryobacterales bacterium]|nr:hypothetical protein [Bryobacterales bacterium]